MGGTLQRKIDSTFQVCFLHEDFSCLPSLPIPSSQVSCHPRAAARSPVPPWPWSCELFFSHRPRSHALLGESLLQSRGLVEPRVPWAAGGEMPFSNPCRAKQRLVQTPADGAGEPAHREQGPAVRGLCPAWLGVRPDPSSQQKGNHPSSRVTFWASFVFG